MKATTVPRLTLIVGCLVVLAAAGCSQKTAEEKGAAMATEKLDLAKGIGGAMEEKGAQAGEAVAAGVGTVFKGFEQGSNKLRAGVVADDSLAKAGLKITRMQPSGAENYENVRALELYVIAEAPAKGKLRVLAMDVSGNEIGRSNVPLEREGDEAKYLKVEFDEQVKLDKLGKVMVSYKPGDVVAKQ
jgi:hypothetical protein